MLKIIQNFNWIIGTSFLGIFLGILTFLTFINASFIPLTEKNLQYLLIIDIILLLIFFGLIFQNIVKIFSKRKKDKTGHATNLKYISLFSLFTFLPSLLIAIFSLILFNFGLDNYFNNQIKNAVNNSYDVANEYLEESRKTLESDIFLMSVGVNRGSGFFYSNKKRFEDIIRSEKILRNIDDVYLIDSLGNIMFSDTREAGVKFVLPNEDDFDKALENVPVAISNNLENKTSFFMKLNSLIDTYLYISRNIDPKIINYLNETEQAVNFYYSVQNNQLGLKITFAIIYIIIVTLLLFLSTVIAIFYASRLTKPIVNLIRASEDISKGELKSKVPIIDTDDEFILLNRNFNNMIDRLKKQQDKLLLTERYSAWESVARKLAHEIKNPLTPIQLSIDRLKEKYLTQIKDNKDDFGNYLETINRQIKDIERLVSEFSDFARMPSPLMKKINIVETVNRAINFMKLSSKNTISLISKNETSFISGDEEHLYRVFINLIKNSEESILEKKGDFKGKIDVEITKNNDYIVVKLTDNGVGIKDKKNIMTPYFTTKKDGTGLGLPIVNKIINDHSGEFSISNRASGGVEVLISIPKINE